MPGVGPAFSGLHCDTELTDEELARAIHFMMAAELEAIQLNLQLSQSAGNAPAADALKSVACEDRSHMAAFLNLLVEPVSGAREFRPGRAKDVDTNDSWVMGSLCRATCVP